MIISDVKLSNLDKANGNGYILPTEVIQNFINDNPSYTKNCGMDFAITTPVPEVSHKLSNLTVKNGFLYGDVEVFDTPQGKVLKDVIEKFGSENICGAYVATVGSSNDDENKVVESVSKVMCFYSESGRNY